MLSIENVRNELKPKVVAEHLVRGTRFSKSCTSLLAYDLGHKKLAILCLLPNLAIY